MSPSDMPVCISASMFACAPPLETPARIWIALRVRPNLEQVIALHLRNKGYEDFVPIYKESSDPRVVCDRSRPLFPGYVFCKFGGITPNGLIVKTPGVIRILGVGGRPTPVPEEEILALQRISVSGINCRPSPYLTVGDRVRIVRGPLAGIEGILTRVANKRELVVSVEMLQRAIAVHIDASYLLALPRK